MAEQLTTDYLVIGGGAMGMAFADVLVTETDAHLTIVDRHHQPGGHWNDAYPFVRLHQPSLFYGVNSRELGSGAIDYNGWNKGLYELASGHEVCCYFDQVMQQQFLPSGRVQYYPMSEYVGDGRIRSLVSGKEFSVDAKKTVDATYMNVTVPSTREPGYRVADGVDCLPPNELPRVAGKFERYVVVGAGKTAMDSCLFLLQNTVDPARITWVMPRDSWLLDRAALQPGEFFHDSLGEFAARQAEAIAAADSINDVLERVERSGFLIRFADEIWPTMYRCATVTRAEFKQLKRINNVVRMGRVASINETGIVLDHGTIATTPTTLHIDCTADGAERRPPSPVFAGNRITLQSVRTCQQVFSAALIGHVESKDCDEQTKNEICTPVPHPDTYVDFLRTSLTNYRNGVRWAQDPELSGWIQDARLNALNPRGAGDGERYDYLARLHAALPQAIENLERLLSASDNAESIER
tara:strand:- start:3537 stop:4940 length:1404 start_codon:yes stop_codon:yes gene_type:complete